MTSDAALIEQWNAVAHKINSQYNISDDPFDVDPRILKAIRYLRDSPRNITILDVGCGAGHLLRLLQHLGFTNLTGTEISPDRVKIASDHSHGIRYICSDTLTIFSSESFDAITATGVIEHLEHPEDFYKECYRILKPGGKLIVTSDCYLFRLQKALGFYRTIQPIDNAPFPTKVIKTATNSGFSLVHYDAWGSWWFHPYLAVTNFVSNITPKSFRKHFISTYDKYVKKASHSEQTHRDFTVEQTKDINNLATLKCIFLLGDVFYFQKTQM